MTDLLRFSGAVERDPAVERWLNEHTGELGAIAQQWFSRMRDCGPDVRELLHDGCPTVCLEDVAVAYVNVLKAHVNVGFFLGAELPNPAGLLEGTGKRMRHVKLKPGLEVDTAALRELIDAAYEDVVRRLKRG